MAETAKSAVAVVGIDVGKKSFHIVGLDRRGAIVLRQKWSRGQVEARFASMPPCLDGGLCRGPSPQSQAPGAWS
jgi:transposase